MKRVVWIAMFLIVLVASNAWWAYHAIDNGVTTAYREDSSSAHRGALVQALAIMPVAARSDSTREQVIEAARSAAGRTTTPFEKDGFVWVGWIGLKFSESGRLIEVAPAWRPF